MHRMQCLCFTVLHAPVSILPGQLCLATVAVCMWQVAVPYLSHVHWNPRAYASPFNRSSVTAEKTHRVSMIFSVDRKTKFRPILLQQCRDQPKHCLSKKLNAAQQLTTIHDYATLYRKSWYCVMPAGDTPTRMAIYECAALGSIPVVFDSALLKLLPFADVLDWESMIELFPGIQSIEDGQLHIVDDLLSIPEDAMMTRLAQLSAFRHTLQYSTQPQHLLIRSDQLQVIHPLDDAFTCAVKAVFRNVCRRGLIGQDRCQ